MTCIPPPYRLYQDAVYTGLAGLNARHLKVNLPFIATFLADLVWTHGRASCSAIAPGGAFTHAAPNRLLVGHRVYVPCRRWWR